MAHRFLISITAALLAGVLYSYGADSQTAPASASIANDMLSKDVLHGLKQIENGLRLTGEPGIRPFGSPKVIQKVVAQPPNESGVWIEEWQIQRFGYVVEYAIKFMPAAKGGTDVSIFQPAWRTGGLLDYASSLSRVAISEAKWIAGIVSRTPGMKGKYRVEASEDEVRVSFDADVDAAQSAAASQNLRKMRDDLRAFYGKAPKLMFKFRNAEFTQ